MAEDSTNIAVDLTTLTDDVDGDALTYTITTPLANGTLTPTGTPGIYTYTPNANFTGPDSFTYTVTDARRHRHRHRVGHRHRRQRRPGRRRRRQVHRPKTPR